MDPYDILDELLRANPKDFRYFHGYALTLFWFIFPLLGLVAKKVHALFHAVVFLVANMGGYLILGIGFYRKRDKLLDFRSASGMAHAIFAIIFALLMLINHLGGVITFSSGKPNQSHREGGWILTSLGRLVVCVGWWLMGQYAILGGCLALSVILTIVTKPSERKAKDS